MGRNRFNWNIINNAAFDNYMSAAEYVIGNYSVAQINSDIKEKREDYIDSREGVDRFYTSFENEIHSYLTIEAARELASAAGVTGYEDVKKLHVNKALKHIIKDVHRINEKLFEKHPHKEICDLIDLDVLADWGNLSYENLLMRENLESFMGRDKGKQVLGAINLIHANQSQLFALGEDVTTLLGAYPKDFNSQENYEEYSDSVGRNLAELLIQMTNAGIRETYHNIYDKYKEAIIKNPDRRISDIAVSLELSGINNSANVNENA